MRMVEQGGRFWGFRPLFEQRCLYSKPLRKTRSDCHLNNTKIFDLIMTGFSKVFGASAVISNVRHRVMDTEALRFIIITQTL